MRPLSAPLLAHYQQPLQTLARCVRIERQDGIVLGLTEHDQDLFFEEVTYSSAAGYRSTALQTSHQLAVGTVEIEGILHAAGVAQQEIVAGLFDNAHIEIFEVNYADLSQGKLVLLCGYWGETQLQGQRFITEFRSTAQNLQQPVGECYSPTCRAQLGDARCSVDLNFFTHPGSVTAVISATEIMAADLTQADHYFTGGHLLWESGANRAIPSVILSFQAGGRVVFERPPYSVKDGDSIVATAGCNKRLVTCRAKFNNVVNFRGEPFVPEREESRAP
jgi:uncharacterized phage protein (TIGR02218 family)